MTRPAILSPGVAAEWVRKRFACSEKAAQNFLDFHFGGSDRPSGWTPLWKKSGVDELDLAIVMGEGRILTAAEVTLVRKVAGKVGRRKGGAPPQYDWVLYESIYTEMGGRGEVSEYFEPSARGLAAILDERGLPVPSRNQLERKLKPLWRDMKAKGLTVAQFQRGDGDNRGR